MSEFRHEALLYADQDEFATGTLGFINDGLDAGEPVLVVLAAEKIDLLTRNLGPNAAKVRFADMAQVGANPARIIAEWLRFANECTSDGRPFRGIGEPIWAGRTPDELVECQRHEELLNLAFADAVGFTLMCPYDTVGLTPDVIDEALRSHPHIIEGAVERPSGQYRDLCEVAAPFDRPLPEPEVVWSDVEIDPRVLGQVRAIVRAHAPEVGLGATATADLILAVNEIATNSLVHGGGRGRLRIWGNAQTIVCEIRDGGRIEDPLVGRIPPPHEREGGRGLWLATQLCDLVQVRTYATGSVVRMHMHARR